jgi:hypothetical protein
MRFLFSFCSKIGEFWLQKYMRSYDMECVAMRKRGNQFLSLEVPGLAERRPSLVQGDFILAKLASEYGNDASCKYQVCVKLGMVLYLLSMVMVRSFSLYDSNSSYK